MKVSATVEGLQELNAQIAARMAAQVQASAADVVVGYTAAAALYVHENIEMKWKGQPRRSGLGVYWGPKGNAKFLEAPTRTLRDDGTLVRLIGGAVGKGKTLLQGMLLAGLRIQRDSQLQVPVEYGNLRASAFTRIEPKD